jgi:hypothetical protein
VNVRLSNHAPALGTIRALLLNWRIGSGGAASKRFSATCGAAKALSAGIAGQLGWTA